MSRHFYFFEKKKGGRVQVESTFFFLSLFFSRFRKKDPVNSSKNKTQSKRIDEEAGKNVSNIDHHHQYGQKK
jgi:hypothetical protein